MGKFYFKPSARLQRYLGNELIADPILAVLEFVKNAYDAGAENVYISFEFPSTGPSRLTIADDGEGMDEASFERNWMHPGYSEKSPDAKKSRAQRGLRGRVPVGEKGLGRLAAGRLGRELEVFTRRTSALSWLHTTFPWSKFDDMTKALDKIPIAYDLHTPPPPEPVINTGTVLVIRDLLQDWTGRVRGRPLPGRSRTKLGRLKQDLGLLIRPIQPSDTPFTIHLDSESFLDPGDVGTITPAAATEDTDYVYDFEYRREAGGAATIRRRLHRSGTLVSEFGGKKDERLPVERLTRTTKEPQDRLPCGPFKGRFLYTPPPAAKRAREIDAIGSGVLLYRDGVLVEPYGLDSNDWVGAQARKAQRQGYALVQPNLFSGFVLINRADNPELRDMSNRLGLLENDVSETFISYVQSEFGVFEGKVFDELKQRWESKEEKAGKQAEETIDLAAVRLRAIAHSLGQPLMGLDADIAGIRIVAKKPGIPSDLSTNLLELASSASNHLSQARASLARFREIPSTDRVLVSIGEIVAESIRPVRGLAKSLGIGVRVDLMPNRKVLVHRELVVEAVTELLRNAIEASRGQRTGGYVKVGHHLDDGNVVLDIRDDGVGISGWTTGLDLASVESTKGRPGMGLSTVAEIVAASRGRVRLTTSGPQGTHVELILPERLKGLRQD